MRKSEKTALVATICALAGMVVGMVVYTRKKIDNINFNGMDADDDDQPEE